MKLFEIKIKENKISLENKDPDPKIKSVVVTIVGLDYCFVNVVIPNETQAIRNEFLKIPDIFTNIPLGYEEIAAESVKAYRDQFVKLAQAIESFPLEFICTLKEHGVIFQQAYDAIDKAQTKGLKDAISEAVTASSESSPEEIARLANYYQENNQFEEYLAVLKSVPKDNPFFMEANKIIFDYLNSTNDNQTSEKFKRAYNANLDREAECYFAQLAGEKGIKSLVELPAGSNPDLLISLALVIREKNKEIEDLKSKIETKDKKETTLGFFS